MTTAPETDVTTRSQRFRLGARLTLAAVAAFLVAVPFLVIVVLVRGQVPWLLDLDQDVASSLHRLLLRHEALEDAAQVVDVATQPNVLRVLALLTTVALWVRGRRRVAIWLVVTIAAGSVLNWVIKDLVARARPAFPDAFGTFPGYSFPSGHAMNSAVAAGCVIVLLHPRRARRGPLGAVGRGRRVRAARRARPGGDRRALRQRRRGRLGGGGGDRLRHRRGLRTLADQEGLPPATAEAGLDPENSAAENSAPENSAPENTDLPGAR